MAKVLRGILLALIFVVLLLPLAEQKLRFTHPVPLDGYVRNTPRVSFSWKGWWDGSYQGLNTEYLNDSMGFRYQLVRLNNQIDYTLFKKPHAEGIVVGKEQCLYEDGYLLEYNGKYFVGSDSLLKELRKLKKVQDTLEAMGKTVLFMFAPSKARYYPQYITKEYWGPPTDSSNYTVMAAGMRRMGIKHIDANAWFAQHRLAKDSLLMSKQGIHWTKFGAMLASDSITRFIEQQRHIKMKRLNIKKINFVAEPWERQERDLSLAMNLMAPLTTERYDDAEYSYVGDSTSARPNIIFIGDSFLWTIGFTNYYREVYKHWETWYYCHEVWSDKETQGMSTYDWPGAIRQIDVVVFVFAEINLTGNAAYTIDKFYDHYYGAVKP